MRHFLLGLVFLISAIGMAQQQPYFERGKQHYADQSYQQAIDSWMQIIHENEHSAALYFNLGNAHYKLNNIGLSIYYYEKALQLAPNDEDILNNLAFAENAKIDAVEPLPETIFSKWYARVSGVLSYEGWAVFAIVCSSLFTFLFLWYYFARGERRKRLLFVGALVAVLCFLVALTLAFSTYDDAMRYRPAIVVSEEVEVKSEPNMGSDSSFLLHEGTKVQILVEDGNWVRIEIADGKDGWIPLSELKPL
ncbi:MAG: ion channel protein [Flavobacteriaceae bacterium]|nr:ion channel protein [Flavobacteriaceae bacterium]